MKRATREAIFRAGTVLSNIAHNLSQPSWTLDNAYRQSMKRAQRDWDAALALYRADIANSKQRKGASK